MAVRPAITVLPSTPVSSPLSATNPSLKKRWPPMADRTSLPYKLTTLSKQKLAREATAPDPDIRRCLCHFRLHVRSVEWTQNAMTAKINSFELESESESETEPEDEDHPQDNQDSSSDDCNTIKTKQPEPEHLPVPLATGANNDAESIDKVREQNVVQIHFEVAPPPASPSSDKEKDKDGLLEKGRNCLEKTVQRKSFWPSPGQCIPVRIAG